MLEAALIGSFGLLGGLLVFAFWQAKRAANASDKAFGLLERATSTERQLDARGVAVADRDRTITFLEDETRRLRAALVVASPAFISPDASVKESADALRAALGGVRPSDPARSVVPPVVPDVSRSGSEPIKDR